MCAASPHARHYHVCLSTARSLKGTRSLVKEGEESFKSENKAYFSLVPGRRTEPSYFHNSSLTGVSRQSEGHVALIKALAQEQISASLTYREKPGKLPLSISQSKSQAKTRVRDKWWGKDGLNLEENKNRCMVLNLLLRHPKIVRLRMCETELPLCPSVFPSVFINLSVILSAAQYFNHSTTFTLPLAFQKEV